LFSQTKFNCMRRVHTSSLLGGVVELIIPVFFGCLGALIFSAFLMTHIPVGEQDFLYEVAENNPDIVKNAHFSALIGPGRPDIILEQYRDPATRGRVVDFFGDLCASTEIAEIILANAHSFDIAPALAFALAWEESRFNQRAVNSKNRDGSVDRGLFQLNNRSFPRLDTPVFFNPNMNAWYAMNHLRHCLDTGGSEVAALAMYNAGTNRVTSEGTPKLTLDYISRILNNRWEIENQFKEQEPRLQEPVDVPEIAEAKPEHPRLVPLMPLAGR
jgi:hypothetical protein